MAIAFVKQDSNGGGSGTTTCTFVGSTTSGNLIVVGISIEDSTSTVSSVTDSKGNTYQAATSISAVWNTNRRIQIYYAYNITGGASHTVTVTISGGSTRVNAVVNEYSGALASANPLDVTSSGSAGDDPNTGSATTTTDGSLIYSVVAAAGTLTAGAGGFTKRNEYVFNIYTASEDRVQTTAGSVSAGWTTAGTATGIAQMATFKDAAAATATLRKMCVLGAG